MTVRERAALILLTVGAVCVGVAAYGYGGWKALTGVTGVILLTIGVLLGLEGEPAPALEPVEHPVYDDAGQLIGYETEDGVQRG